MRELKHFSTAERAASSCYGKSNIFSNLIFIKNENKVVDLKDIEGMGGDCISIYKRLLSILEKA